jgi:hypothetical protein
VHDVVPYLSDPLQSGDEHASIYRPAEAFPVPGVLYTAGDLTEREVTGGVDRALVVGRVP